MITYNSCRRAINIIQHVCLVEYCLVTIEDRSAEFNCNTVAQHSFATESSLSMTLISVAAIKARSSPLDEPLNTPAQHSIARRCEIAVITFIGAHEAPEQSTHWLQ